MEKEGDESPFPIAVAGHA